MRLSGSRTGLYDATLVLCDGTCVWLGASDNSDCDVMLEPNQCKEELRSKAAKLFGQVKIDLIPTCGAEFGQVLYRGFNMPEIEIDCHGKTLRAYTPPDGVHWLVRSARRIRNAKTNPGEYDWTEACVVRSNTVLAKIQIIPITIIQSLNNSNFEQLNLQSKVFRCCNFNLSF